MSLLMAVLMLLSVLPASAATAKCPSCGSASYQWGYDPIEEPTCTEPGRAWVGWCGDCGKEQYETIPALGHDWGPWVSRADATCTEGTIERRYCNRCGKEESREVNALGHNWGSWKTTKEPTCTESGKQEHTCTRCGKQETDTISALGHNWGKVNVIRESTCIEKGQAKHTCSRCGKTETYSLKLADHKWGEWHVALEPKPCSKGYEERKCSVCGKTEQRDLYPDGTLFRGDKSDAVRHLQEALNAAGYDCGKADGIFGKKTEAAIKQFQQDQGMDPDGVGYPCLPGKLDDLTYPTAPPDPDVIVPPTVTLALLTPPANGEYYELGEELVFEETMVNNGNYRYEEMCLMFRFNSPFEDGNNLCDQSSGTSLDAGSSWSTSYNAYVITEEDMMRGSVTCYGAGLYPFASNQRLDMDDFGTTMGRVLAAPITVPVGSEGDEPTPDWFEQITLTKSISGNSPFAYGTAAAPGDEIEYILTLTNNTDRTMVDVEIIDPLKGNNEDSVVTLGETLAPGQSLSCSFSYAVTAADAEAGEVINTATAWWVFEDDTVTAYNTNSNTVTVPVGDTNVEGWLAKACYGTPMNGFAFMPGETIHYVLTLYNTGSVPFKTVDIMDPLCGMPYSLGTFENVQPGESAEVSFDYTVTEEDAENAQVTNQGCAVCVLDDGASITVESNTVIVPATDAPFGIFSEMVVTKAETSSPANGSYYTEGETITYTITYANTGEIDFGETIVYDALNPVGSGEIASAEMLHSGETRSCTFQYTVTAADVQKGYVANIALVSFDENGITRSEKSNIVISDTDGNPDADEPEFPGSITTPIILSGEGEDYVPCMCELLSRGNSGAEYETSYCSLHVDTQNAIKTMLSTATTDAAELKVWQYTRVLWQTEIDEMYEAILLACDPIARINVMDERIQFYAMIGCHEAVLNDLYHDQPALVAGKIAEMLMNKSVSMCYELHTAPEARVDALVHVPADSYQPVDCIYCIRIPVELDNGHVRYAEQLCNSHALTLQMRDALIAAAEDPVTAWETVQQLWNIEMQMGYNMLTAQMDADGRNAMMADYKVFINWMASRTTILRAFYPDQPELVLELIARAAMERVVDICNAQK